MQSLLISSQLAKGCLFVSSSRESSNLKNKWKVFGNSLESLSRLKSSTRSTTNHTNVHFKNIIRHRQVVFVAMSFSDSSTTTPLLESKFVPGIPIPSIVKIPVAGNESEKSYYPVNRVYCVGKNYIDHVKEMGGNPRSEAPCFFMKPSNAIVPCGRWKRTTTLVENEKLAESPVTQIAYPLATNNLHYEVELVVALGNIDSDGISNISMDDVSKVIYGYGIGIDLTRRDIQSHAKQNGLPWCTSKGFDQSAPISHIYPITLAHVYDQLHLPLMQNRDISSAINDDDDGSTDDESTTMWLKVNGQIRQRGSPIRDMIWTVPEIIVQLSQLYTLRGGDIIFTGTPAGVSHIVPFDTITAGMNAIGDLEFVLQPR